MSVCVCVNVCVPLFLYCMPMRCQGRVIKRKGWKKEGREGWPRCPNDRKEREKKKGCGSRRDDDVDLIN